MTLPPAGFAFPSPRPHFLDFGFSNPLEEFNMLPALLAAVLSIMIYLITTLSRRGPSFVPEDIPDLSDKTILITGGNSGIGYQTAKELLLKGATVYLSARGVMEPPDHMLTAQNIDLQFGTNVVGHFFLTELLIPALFSSAKTRGLPARIINVSSSGHRNAPLGPGIDFASLSGGHQRDELIATWGTKAPTYLYGQSKLGNILISNHFAAKSDDTQIISTALHPGGIRTELRRYGGGIMHTIKNKLLYPPSMGTLTQLWAATVAPAAAINGQYLVPWAQIAPGDGADLDQRAANLALRDELITWLEERIEGF
ncbi:Short-chain dehydrogenase/reductase family protein [Mycena venus]|uniref:Short-chain dehydrogenase/reductase family protein n=1 Tax=Mycena venus TaxID=2733690 RepID=A0A8H6WRC7_9AGAR|nr:Short-chain dehydrogenase/reductase family protein [Mycena venus]